MVAKIEIWPYVFVEPGPLFSATDDEKFRYPEQSIVSADLINYPSDHEVCGAIIYLTGPFSNTSPIVVTFKAYNNDTGKLLWEGSYNIPTPTSQGWEWWNWYNVKFWIGHAAWEIDGPMKVKMDVTVEGSDVITTSKTVYQDMIDTSIAEEPPENWWESLQSFLGDVIIEGMTIQDALVKWKILPEWIGNIINELIDLFTINVAPEGEPPLRVVGIGGGTQLAKLPKVSATVGAKIVANLNGKAWLKAIDVMKLNPLKYTKLFRELPIETARKVLRTLRKDDAASLARNVFGKAFDEKIIKNAPFWNQLIFQFIPTKTTTIKEVYKWALMIWGIDTLVDWGAIDNFGFITAIPANKAEESFLAGTMTKEEALEKIDNILKINELGIAKVETSKFFNPFALIFGEIFIAIAKGNRDNVLDTKARIEAAEIPLEKGILTIKPVPSDAKVSVEGQIPTTGIFSSEISIGFYDYVVSKFGYTSKSGTIELTEEGLEITVEIEKEVVPPEELAGELIISVEPSEAKVIISGRPEIKREGTYTLPIGPYTIYFELEGYKPSTKYAEVEAAKPKTVSVVLIKEEEPEPEKAELLITSKPSFADVMIDGKSTFQKTPYTAFLDEGTHKIRVELSGYEPKEEEITLSWGDEKSMEFVLTKTPPTKGTLRILSEPSGAQVYIDGISQFVTTPFTITLTSGTYKIRLTKEGYLPDETDIVIEAGVEKEHKVELTPTPITQATIMITSEPTEADIYIDGKYQFVKTPYTVMLDPKDYIFRIQKAGYYPIEIIAEVEEGEVSEIPFILEAIPDPEIPPEPYIPYEPYYPVYEPAVPYVPSIIPTLPGEISPYDYALLYPEVYDIPEVEPVGPPVEKELLINIETTDLMPTEGRIYSIAFLDLSDPLAETQIAVLNDEAALIDGFLDFFETGLYTKLTGYNVAFDYRYIFTKMMKYRRVSKAWKNVELRDVMQIMQQVKEAFVFGYNKPGTLDEWGKALLGKGKYGTQELMLRKYLQGDFDYVRSFQNRQIELTRDLYTLARFVSSEAFISSSVATPEMIVPSPESGGVEALKPEGQKVCPSCKAFQPLSARICDICGVAI